MTLHSIDEGIDLDPTNLATPTGVLLYDGPPKEDGWYAVRRGGITATDVVAIIGEGYSGNATQVWAQKLGLLPDDDGGNKAAKWGILQEPLVADDWAAQHRASIRPIGVIANVHQPWQRASLDRVVLGCPEGRSSTCPLEIKTKSAFLVGRWRDDVPDDVMAQVQWQMLVAGYDHAHVAVLFGGNDDRAYTVERDDVVIAYLEQEARRIWDHVLAGTRPDDIHDDKLIGVLNRLYADRAGVHEYGDLDRVRELVAAREHVRARQSKVNRLVKALEKQRTAADAALIDLLGEHEAVTVPGLDGRPVVAYPEKSKRGYTVAPKTFRQLVVDADLITPREHSDGE